MKKAVLLLSGGIDSTTLLYELREQGVEEITAIVFDYRQTLRKEIDFAVDNASRVGASVKVAESDLSWIGSSCSLLSFGDKVTHGRTRDQIAEGGTPPSYVPFRNGIFLSYAVAFGEVAGVTDIYFGGNGLESGNYWDDTLVFADAFGNAANQGTCPQYRPQIHAPYSGITKRQIVRKGRRIGVDYDLTWSCYLNGHEHCGTCDSCVQRIEALK